MASEKVCVLPGRMAHLSVVIDNSLYMIGGYHRQLDENKHGSDKTVNMAEINIYSLREGKWRRKRAGGDVPVSGSGMCMTSHRHYIYAFGGLLVFTNNGETRREFSNSLHVLNTKTLIWEKLVPAEGDEQFHCDLPSLRDKAAMVYYNNALYVFAGWGIRISRIQPNSQFLADPIHQFVGWNNELWMFDLATRKWTSPSCEGHIPSPRAAHTLTMCNDNTAVLFGGRTREGRVSELYFLNLDKLQWLGPVDAGPGPEKRSLHTFTRLHDDNILLLGGMDSNGEAVKTQWVLLTKPEIKWVQVKLHKAEDCARTWHTTSASCKKSYTELCVFGGSPDNIWEPDHKYLAHMVRFIYGIKPLYDICIEKILKSKIYPNGIPLDIDDDIKTKGESDKLQEDSDHENAVIYEMSTLQPASGAS